MSLRIGIWVMLAGILGQAMPARSEGVGIGNGAGAWVCREKNGDVRWATLVDLYEAQSQGKKLTIANYPGSYTEIVDLVRLRLFEANQDLFAAISPHLKEIDYLRNKPPVNYTADHIEVIDDALFDLRPSVNRCAGGMLVIDPKSGKLVIPYEQLVNFKGAGESIEIDVQSELFVGKNAAGNDNLSSAYASADVARAATVFHEAVYAYRREMAGDKDSRITRKIVGLLFSTLSVEELKRALEKLGEGEVPITGMSFAKIPAGSFMMGSCSDDDVKNGRYGCVVVEEGRRWGELRQLMSISEPFEIMKTEVTQVQWFEFMGVNPSLFIKPENCPKNHSPTVKKIPGFIGCPNNPVETVSWDMVQNFLVKLNRARKDGHYYRLPTSAEWEYAARGETQSPYFWGSKVSEAPLYAWFNPNSDRMTHEVALLKPNPYGLFDTSGNVHEWVSDFFSDKEEAFPNGGPLAGKYHVNRGAAWYDYDPLRSAETSYGEDPSPGILGFRLVRQ